jgi:dihydropyrimidinase
MCSPPLRDRENQTALWQALGEGLFDVVSSDHSPFTFDSYGKLADGPNPAFWKIANGLPGLEARLPILFSEGVMKGRISLNQFVALTSTNAAKLYGLHPKKGSLSIGADADIAVWEPDKMVRLCAANMHDNTGFTPYEGMEVQGWPTITISRGEVIVKSGQSSARLGRGKFLPCLTRRCVEVKELVSQ